MKKSFTLIELLVVIAIIGILAAIAMPSISNARAKARDSRRLADLNTLKTAMELYFSDYNHYPIWESGCLEALGNPLIEGATSSPAFFTDKYIRTPPKDPLPNKYCYYYQSDETGGNYKIAAYLEKDKARSADDNGTASDFYEVYGGPTGSGSAIALTNETLAAAMPAGAPPPPEEEIPILGDGSDGALTITSVNTIVNNYTYLTGNELSGDSTITVNNASVFSAGNEILIIQMQDYGGGEAGKYEFKKISSINENNLVLKSAISNNYYSGTFDAINSTVTAVVRVPRYTDVLVNSGSSITSDAWDGYKGGIVVFRANGTVTINGSIDNSAKGFRGGNPVGGYPITSQAGEDIKGKGQQNRNPGTGGGGGAYHGTEDYSGSGAGGGGYGTAGENGLKGTCSYLDRYGYGGTVYGSADLTKIFLGSGGGAGINNNANYGGAGGGIVMIFANQITTGGNALITTSGQNAVMGNLDEWASGGGAGGSIYLKARTINLSSNSVIAIGGLGGHATSNGCVPTADGGGGGVGRIRLDYNSLSGTTNPLSYNGTF